MSYDGTEIVTVKGVDYRVKFWLMTKHEAVDRVKNTDISKKLDSYNDEKNGDVK